MDLPECCTRTDNVLYIRVGDSVEVGVELNEKNEFLGIGSVLWRGVALRDATVPLYPWIKSLQGVQYTRFKLDSVEKTDSQVRLITTAFGQQRLEGEYGDQYDARTFTTRQECRVVEDKLTWILQPEEYRVGDLDYTGFSYAWRFCSATEQIGRIVAHTTWEIGGHADGNTLLSLGQVTPPVYTAELDTQFTSACLIRLRDFDAPQNMSFQFNPRYGSHQSFDFQVGEAGSLIGFWPDRADVRSFVQKNPGEDVFFVMDDTHFQASADIEIPRKCICFAPAGPEGVPEHVQRNRWKDAHDFCGELTRNLFGIKQSRPLPESRIPYKMKLEDDNTLRIRVRNEWVAPQDWLRAMSDTYFEELSARGIRRIIPEPICQTDPTERGLYRKLNSGIHGDFVVGSCCCVHRYVPSEFWGGTAAWRYYYDKAHSLGLEVGHWIGPHLAHHAPILREHPDWYSRNFNTWGNAGGYPDLVLASLNWNTGVRQWIFEDIKRWHEEWGLDYVWFDSLSNLGMLPVDYAKLMQPNAEAIAEFIADLQSIGIKTCEVEGMSPFGICSAGVFDPNQGTIRDAQDIAGQNTWDWYVGNEDMFCDQMPKIEFHPERSEEEARQTLFRCLANRCTPHLGAYSVGFGPKPGWFRTYLDAYFAVEPFMQKRRLLPNRQGVYWHGDSHDALFAFSSFEYPLPNGAQVERLDGEVATDIACQSVLRTDPWNIYRIRP